MVPLWVLRSVVRRSQPVAGDEEFELGDPKIDRRYGSLTLSATSICFSVRARLLRGPRSVPDDWVRSKGPSSSALPVAPPSSNSCAEALQHAK